MGTLFLNDAELREIREKIETYPWAGDLYELVKGNAARKRLVEDWPHPHWFWSKVARDKALVYAISGDDSQLSELVDLLGAWFGTDDMAVPLERVNDWGFGFNYGGFVWAYDLVKEHRLFRGELGKKLEQRFAEILKGHRESLSNVREERWYNTSFWYAASVGMLGFLLDESDAVRQAIDGEFGFKRALERLDDGFFWPEATDYGHNYVTCVMTILAEASLHNEGEDLYQYVAPSGSSLKSMHDGLIGLLFADGRLATHGDASSQAVVKSTMERHTSWDFDDCFLFNNQCWGETNKWEVIYRRYRDPRYAWLISQDPTRRSWDHTFWGYPALTHGVPLGEIEPPSAQSAVFPEHGSAIVRSEEGPEYWGSSAPAIHLRDGSRKNHGHQDHFGLVLHAFGRLIYPDWFIQWDYLPRMNQYADPKHAGLLSKTPFCKRLIAHNSLSVDCSEPDQQDSVSYSPIRRQGDMKVVAFEGCAYQGVHQKRVLGLTREYLLDITTAESDEPHIYDYHLHGFGALTLENVSALERYDNLGEEYGLGKIDERPSTPGNVWIRPGQRGEARGDWSARFMDDGFGSHVTVLEGEDTEVFSSNTPYHVSERGWDDWPEDGVRRSLPLLLVRRRACSTTFVVVHQPFNGVSRSLVVASEGDTLAIKGEGFTDRITLPEVSYVRVQ